MAILAAPIATGSSPSKTPAPAQQQSSPRGDSVLAEIGNRRTVDLAAFRQAWTQVTPPARPDSLTPQAARWFLDLLIDKEILAARALEESWVWTPSESAQLANLRDRAVLRAALDSALVAAARARASRGEPPLGLEPLGVAVRESTVAHLDVTYDEALVARLARSFAALPRPSSDSSLAAWLRAKEPMPVIAPADSASVLARSKVGSYTVSEMLEAWRKLDPVYRPRVDTPEQLRELAENGLFERALRRDAARHHLERHPSVVAWEERQRGALAVQRFLAREVADRVPTDDRTLRRHYDRHPERWQIPTRLRIVRLVLPGRSDASRMALHLRDAAQAESLVSRGLRQGVDYRAEITATSDSALFAAALKSGTGTVLGPDSVSGGWEVARVNAVLPSRARSFEETRGRVLRSWSEEAGEQRLKALLATLRQRTRVVIHEQALDRLVRDGVPTAANGTGS